MIEFIMQNGETIPTDLMVKVDDEIVVYDHIFSGYRFQLLTSDEAKAMGAVNQIIAVMIREHADLRHGVTWVTESLRVVPQEERYRIGTIIDWKYRIRDTG